jgi:hypothetical protein
LVGRADLAYSFVSTGDREGTTAKKCRSAVAVSVRVRDSGHAHGELKEGADERVKK